MADGLGLLEAQQSAAARIPYENVQRNQQQAGNVASLFLNAFHAAAQANAQRQRLEEQLKRTQLQMSKMEFDEQFKEKDFQRKMEMQQFTGLLRENALEKQDEWHRASADIASQKLDLANAVYADKYHKTTEENTQVKDYAEAVGEYNKTHVIGTADYLPGLINIQSQYTTGLNSSAGKFLARSHIQEAENAAKQISSNAKLALDTLKSDMATNSKSGLWTPYDLQRPPESLRRDKQGNVIIDEVPVKVPGTNTIVWQQVPGSEVDKLSTADQKTRFPGIRQRIAAKNHYDRWQSLQETVDKYRGGGPLAPATVQPKSPSDKRENAISILKQNNKPVTDANIQHVLNQLGE